MNATHSGPVSSLFYSASRSRKPAWCLAALLCLYSAGMASAQTTLLLNSSTNGTTQTGTSYSLYDSGGSAGNYTDNQNYTVTFQAPVGSTVKFVLNSLTTEADYDYLYVYNGPTTASPLLGTYHGSASGVTLNSTSNTLTVKFTSDGGVVAAGFFASITHQSAASLAPADPYNVFVFGNMTESNVDSEGRVAVGGIATFTNFGIGSTFSGNPSSAGNSLVVGGNLSYNGGEVHYGSVVYGGTKTGTFSCPNGTVTQGSVINFASAQSTLTSNSSYWGGLAATGTTSYVNGGELRLTGTNASINIFSVTAAQLSGAYAIKIGGKFFLR